MEAQGSLTVAFSSSATLYGVSGSGEFAGQSSTQHHGHLTNFWCFWQCGQVPNPAGK